MHKFIKHLLNIAGYRNRIALHFSHIRGDEVRYVYLRIGRVCMGWVVVWVETYFC